MHIIIKMMVTISLISVAACADVRVLPVSKYDKHTEGFRVPTMKPVIVVAGANVSVLMVCNPDHGSAVDFGSFLAKHHFVMHFNSCGAPSDVDSDQDSTAAIEPLFQFLTEASKSFLPGQTTSGSTDKPMTSAAFQIYDVRFDADDSIQLVPLVRAGDLIQVRAQLAAGVATSGTVPARTGTSLDVIPGTDSGRAATGTN